MKNVLEMHVQICVRNPDIIINSGNGQPYLKYKYNGGTDYVTHSLEQARTLSEHTHRGQWHFVLYSRTLGGQIKFSSMHARISSAHTRARAQPHTHTRTYALTQIYLRPRMCVCAHAHTDIGNTQILDRWRDDYATRRDALTVCRARIVWPCNVLWGRGTQRRVRSSRRSYAAVEYC